MIRTVKMYEKKLDMIKYSIKCSMLILIYNMTYYEKRLETV